MTRTAPTVLPQLAAPGKYPCPSCGDFNVRVVDSRWTKTEFAMRRRRVCGTCGVRWTTHEKIVRDMSDVQTWIGGERGCD